MNEVIPETVTDGLLAVQTAGQTVFENTNGSYETLGIAGMFVLGILSGLILFKIFSAKWHS